YLIRLADRSGIDLIAACQAKLEKNAQKYPSDKCYGSAKKYNEL
ncbi:MazG-like family protein, partial [Photobacterium damselae]